MSGGESNTEAGGALGRAEGGGGERALGALLRFGLPALVLVGGMVALVGLSKLRPARKEATVQERKPLAVRTVALEARSVTLDVVGHGTAQARDVFQLGAEVGGRVAYVASSLRTGSFVEAGEVLVRLDDRERQLARRRAFAETQRLEAEHKGLLATQAHLKVELALRAERAELARTEWQRLKQIGPSGGATPSRVDLAQGAWVEMRSLYRAAQRSLETLPHTIAQAEAAKAQAQVALEQADFDLERLVLRAPARAQVSARNVDLGQIVAPGTPLIGLSGHAVYEVPVQLSHEDLLKLALIPQAAIPRGLKAPPARVGESDAEVRWQGQRWAARLTRIQSVDKETRTIPTVVEVRQPWAKLERGRVPLLPGAYCEVRLRGQTREGAWVVPEHSLREGRRVFVLREGALAIVSVRVDHLLGSEAVITPSEPFRPGDRLIVSAIGFPVVGMRLQLDEGA